MRPTSTKLNLQTSQLTCNFQNQINMALLSPLFMEFYQNSPASKISNANLHVLTEAIFASPKYRHTRGILDDDNRSIIGTPPPPPLIRNEGRPTCSPQRSPTGNTSSDERMANVKIPVNRNKCRATDVVQSVTALTCNKVVGDHSRQRPTNSTSFVRKVAIVELPLPSKTGVSVCDSTHNEHALEDDSKKQSGIAGDFDGDTFMMHSWFVKPTGKSSVFIEGETREEDGYEPKNSSSIVERINARTLLSKTGNIYKLVGRMDEKRAKSSGLPEEFVSHFRNGFPTDWKLIVDKHRHACKGTNIDKSQAGHHRVDAHLNASTGRLKSSIDLSKLPKTRSGRIVFPPLEFWRRQRIVSRYNKTPCIASPSVAVRVPSPTTSQRLTRSRNLNFVEDISEIQPKSFKRNIIQEPASTTVLFDEQSTRSKKLVLELQRMKPLVVIKGISDDQQGSECDFPRSPTKLPMHQSKSNREIGTLKSLTNAAACQTSMSVEKRLLRSASNVACQTEFSRICGSNIACQTDMCGESPLPKKTSADVACQTEPRTTAKVESIQTSLLRSALKKVREISTKSAEFQCPPIVKSNLAVGSPLKKTSETKSRKRRKSPSPSSFVVEANAPGLQRKESSQRGPTAHVSETVKKNKVKQNKQPKIQTKRRRSNKADSNVVSCSITGPCKKVKSMTTKKHDENVVIAGRDTLRFRRQFRDFVNVNCRDDDSDHDDIFATTPYRNTCKLTGLVNLRLNPDDLHEWGSKDAQLTPQTMNRIDHDRNALHLVPVSAKKTPNLHSGVSPFMTSNDDPANMKEIDRYIWNRKKRKRIADRCKPSVRTESTSSLQKTPLLRRAPHLTEIDFGSNGSTAVEDEEDDDYYFSDND